MTPPLNENFGSEYSHLAPQNWRVNFTLGERIAEPNRQVLNTAIQVVYSD
nr:MAG TPA: hypothetical protein [Caudoviricetes sp.]